VAARVAAGEAAEAERTFHDFASPLILDPAAARTSPAPRLETSAPSVPMGSAVPRFGRRSKKNPLVDPVVVPSGITTPAALDAGGIVPRYAAKPSLQRSMNRGGRHRAQSNFVEKRRSPRC
jgi:hypothetical protein